LASTVKDYSADLASKFFLKETRGDPGEIEREREREQSLERENGERESGTHERELKRGAPKVIKTLFFFFFFFFSLSLSYFLVACCALLCLRLLGLSWGRSFGF